ncbi:MAG: peptidylprolyl isomerase [Clostridiales Family XIII bacterium]|nr:peptidylprolyl isomerase [Clostridiales Family XIII bacterium]
MVVLGVMLAFAACDDENAGGTGRSGGSGDGNEVLAVVEGQDITRKQVDDLCAFMAMNWGMTMDDMDESNRTMLFNQMLIYTADNVLIKNYMDESDEGAAEGAKSTVDQQMVMYKSQGADIDQQLSAAGITDDTVKSYIETQYYQELFYEKVKTDDPVTDDEAKAYYDEHKNEFITPASIGLSHILVGDKEHKDADRTSIEAIMKRVENGEDFAELAKRYSSDTGSAVSGGALGVVPKGMMVAPFEEAGFKLKKGEISGIVESDFGFHIIKADTDLIPEQQKPFDSVREQIDGIIAQDHFYEAIKKLKEEHPVKYNVEVDSETGEPSTSLPQNTETDSGDAAK